jgi:hypothetical protein
MLTKETGWRTEHSGKEAVVCTLVGQTETTANGWTCRVKDAYKTMVKEELRVDDRILKYTLTEVPWNNLD